jgi:hypothetical protein
MGQSIRMRSVANMADTRKLGVEPFFPLPQPTPGVFGPHRFGCELKSMQRLPPDSMAPGVAQASRQLQSET